MDKAAWKSEFKKGDISEEVFNKLMELPEKLTLWSWAENLDDDELFVYTTKAWASWLLKESEFSDNVTEIRKVDEGFGTEYKVTIDYNE